MSPSARHKLALCERNPGFPGRKLIFPHRRSRRGNHNFELSLCSGSGKSAKNHSLSSNPKVALNGSNRYFQKGTRNLQPC